MATITRGTKATGMPACWARKTLDELGSETASVVKAVHIGTGAAVKKHQR